MMAEKVQAMREKADELEANITEENFEKLQEINQLIQDGNIAEAKELMAELDWYYGFGLKYDGLKVDFLKDSNHWNKIK